MHIGYVAFYYQFLDVRVKFEFEENKDNNIMFHLYI